MTSNQELRELAAMGQVLTMARQADRARKSWRGRLRLWIGSWKFRYLRPIEIRLRRRLVALAWLGIPDEATSFALETIPDRIALGWFLDATTRATDDQREEFQIPEDFDAVQLALWIYEAQPSLTPDRIQQARDARRARRLGNEQLAKAMFSAIEIIDQEESTQ